MEVDGKESSYRSKLAWVTYEQNNTLYNKKLQALNDIVVYIQGTVHEHLWEQCYLSSTPWDIVKKLKDLVAPTDSSRKQQLLNEYDALKTKKQEKDIDEWLRDWERIVAIGQSIRLPQCMEDNPLREFIIALKQVSPGISLIWSSECNRRRLAQLELPTLSEVINNVRASIMEGAINTDFTPQNGSFATSSSSNSPGPKTSIPTFMGKGADGQEQLMKACLCGELHMYEDCPYFVPAKRPRGWKENEAIYKKINRILNTKPHIKRAIDRVKNRNSSPTSSTSSTSTSSTTSSNSHEAKPPAFLSAVVSSIATSYCLQNSVILDSGATINVCNDQSRFQELSPSMGATIYAGSEVLPIEGYGSIYLTLSTNSNPMKVKLTNVALVPSFHTSVVMCSALGASCLSPHSWPYALSLQALHVLGVGVVVRPILPDPDEASSMM